MNKQETTIIAILKENGPSTTFDIAAKGKLVLANVQKTVDGMTEAGTLEAVKLGNTTKIHICDKPAAPKAAAKPAAKAEKAASKPADKKAADKAAKAAPAAKAPKAAKPVYKDAVTGIDGLPNCRVDKPGVIASITAMLAKNKGKWISRDKMHKMLTTKFKDRSEKSLNTTISNMLSGSPCRIEVDCKKSDKKADITIESKREDGVRSWRAV